MRSTVGTIVKPVQDLYDQKCDVLYRHSYYSYMGQEKSVYAGNWRSLPP